MILDIKLKDLVLWTENPRDPISSESNNQNVANKALQNKDNQNVKIVHYLFDFN